MHLITINNENHRQHLLRSHSAQRYTAETVDSPSANKI